MRVLFTTLNSPPHLYPLVPQAWACQSAGHEVRVAGPPSCAAAIAATGLTGVTVGSRLTASAGPPPAARTALHALNRQRRWPDNWAYHPEQLSPDQRAMVDVLVGKNFAIADAMLDELVEFGRWWRPDLVVYDAVSYAGAVLAQVLGVPAVGQLWGNPSPLRNEMLDFAREPRPGYAALFERFGVAPLIDPVLWLDPCPPSLALPDHIERTPVRYLPFNGSVAAGAPWLYPARTRPRVCVTWGAAADPGQGVPDLFTQTVRQVAALGAELVVAVPAGSRDGLGELPEGTRVLESFPLNALLPTCRALVHHGGAGTALTGVWAGVPQLVLSLRPAQMLVGRALAAAGAGRHYVHEDLLERADLGAVLLEELAPLVLSAAPGAAARRLREELLAQPTPADLVPTLEAAATAVPAIAGAR
jgi:glycosyltransferase